MTQRTEPVHRRLVRIVADLGGVAPEAVDGGTPLLQLGFDSLVLTQFSQRIRREFSVEVAFRDLFGALGTVDAIVDHLVTSRPELADAAQPTTAEPRAEPRTLPSLEVGAAEGGTPGDLARLFQGQLEVLSRQLDMISGGTQGAFPVEEPGDDPQAASHRGESAAEHETHAPTSFSPASPRSGVDPNRELTPHQERALRDFAAHWGAKTRRSKEMVDRQRTHHADPRTAAGFDLRWKELAYPLVVERSKGPWLWDVDGNPYLDLLCGFGPTFFGHSPDFVTQALREQLDRGVEIGPQTPLAGEAARILCELTGLDRATFVCTGSEAVQAAIRLSRTYTGRDKIVVFARDYHGNFDEVLVRGVLRDGRTSTLPGAPGILQRAVDDVIVLQYGADWSMERIRELAPELAAVLVEPVQTRAPEVQPRAFLHELREVTRASGTLLVFDEVVTGFRSHPGGAQAVFGVEADLCTFGKVLGGGMPIGALAGRRPFVDVLDGGPWQFGDDSQPTEARTFFAGTFVRHPLAIVAAHAVLRHLEEAGPGLQRRVNECADLLARRLNQMASEEGLPFEVPHFSSVFYVRLTEGYGGLSSLFFHLLRDEGVYLQEGFPSYLTTTHTDEHVELVCAAFRNAARRMREAGWWPRPEAGGEQPLGLPDDDFGTPPVPGAQLGRDPNGAPAWYLPDPDHPDGYVRVGDA